VIEKSILEGGGRTRVLFLGSHVRRRETLVEEIADSYLRVYHRLGLSYLPIEERRLLGAKIPSRIPMVRGANLVVLARPGTKVRDLVAALRVLAEQLEKRLESRLEERSRLTDLKSSKTEKLSSNKLTKKEGGPSQDE
jgi:hypothetical protein